MTVLSQVPGGATNRTIKRRSLIASIRIGLLSGAMLLALLVLSVPHVAESLGLQPPPGLIAAVQPGPSAPTWPHL